MLATATALAAVPAHAGPWGAGFGWVFLLIPIFWIGLIILIVSLVGRRWRRYGYGPGFGPGRGYGPGFGPGAWSGSAGAEQTLADRFARGDIDEVEYRARLEVLRAGNPGTPGA